MANNQSLAQKKRTERSLSRCQVKQIDVLPDDILLEIFDFYVSEDDAAIEAWQTLVHVCRRWRSLVLASPRRLNLRLLCTRDTPVRNSLSIWTALPLVVRVHLIPPLGKDNTIAALGESERVYDVEVYCSGWERKPFWAALQVPFPELTDLTVETNPSIPTPVIPDSFLDGSAPRLRRFRLWGVTFPGLPKLHLVAPHLVHLGISHTHNSWYFTSEAMATLLTALSSLKTLSLEFLSPSCPISGRVPEPLRPPPSKRSVIPALTCFYFSGDIDYLENLVTFIDTPRLYSLFVVFFDEINRDITRIAQFIDCTPALRALDEAHLRIDYGRPCVAYRSSKSGFDYHLPRFLCTLHSWELSPLKNVCNSLHFCSTVEDLFMKHKHDEYVYEAWRWSELLLQFTTVKNLYISKAFAPDIVGILKELVRSGITITEVFPTLQNIFVEEPKPSGPLQEEIR